ncbi:heme-binding protein [Verrucomicrobiaceae bacterium 227]
MDNKEFIKMLGEKRVMIPVPVHDPTLESAPGGESQFDFMGPLKHLPGEWKSIGGTGWNLIALPFADPNADPAAPPERRLDYRLLMNQYDETLKFDFVDAGVPNRGIIRTTPAENFDQKVIALDYEQTVGQIDQADFPATNLAPPPTDDGTLPGIHREPGLWLNMIMPDGEDLEVNVARLATVPHGDAVLALGNGKTVDGAPAIPDINGFPTGVDQDLEHPYMAPYKHFSESPFKGKVPGSGFPGFSPANPNNLLSLARQAFASRIKKTTVLNVDTKLESGGISNIPFIVKQANATEMTSVFWIYELEGGELRMQYTQTVFLEFFPATNCDGGLIRWPHISINTLVKQ